MTVRFFVTSAALVIFAWLAATYFRAVPMDTYPDTGSTATAQAPVEESAVAATSAEESPGAVTTETVSRR